MKSLVKLCALAWLFAMLLLTVSCKKKSDATAKDTTGGYKWTSYPRGTFGNTDKFVADNQGRAWFVKEFEELVGITNGDSTRYFGHDIGINNPQKVFASPDGSVMFIITTQDIIAYNVATNTWRSLVPFDFNFYDLEDQYFEFTALSNDVVAYAFTGGFAILRNQQVYYYGSGKQNTLSDTSVYANSIMLSHNGKYLVHEDYRIYEYDSLGNRTMVTTNSVLDNVDIMMIDHKLQFIGAGRQTLAVLDSTYHLLGNYSGFNSGENATCLAIDANNIQWVGTSNNRILTVDGHNILDLSSNFHDDGILYISVGGNVAWITGNNIMMKVTK